MKKKQQHPGGGADPWPHGAPLGGAPPGLGSWKRRVSLLPFLRFSLRDYGFCMATLLVFCLGSLFYQLSGGPPRFLLDLRQYLGKEGGAGEGGAGCANLGGRVGWVEGRGGLVALRPPTGPPRLSRWNSWLPAFSCASVPLPRGGGAAWVARGAGTPDWTPHTFPASASRSGAECRRVCLWVCTSMCFLALRCGERRGEGTPTPGPGAWSVTVVLSPVSTPGRAGVGVRSSPRLLLPVPPRESPSCSVAQGQFSGSVLTLGWLVFRQQRGGRGEPPRWGRGWGAVRGYPRARVSLAGSVAYFDLKNL